MVCIACKHTFESPHSRISFALRVTTLTSPYNDFSSASHLQMSASMYLTTKGRSSTCLTLLLPVDIPGSHFDRRSLQRLSGRAAACVRDTTVKIKSTWSSGRIQLKLLQYFLRAGLKHQTSAPATNPEQLEPLVQSIIATKDPIKNTHKPLRVLNADIKKRDKDLEAMRRTWEYPVLSRNPPQQARFGRSKRFVRDYRKSASVY